MKDESLIHTLEIDPDEWQTFEKFELKQYMLWEHPETGASIALLDFPKGSGIPDKHSHASNQFMYCLEGHYEYTDSNLTLKPGSFYGNPKDNPHGPTIAHERSILLEFYDGPHYYEMPDFHTQSTIGKVTENATNKSTYLVIATSKKPFPGNTDSAYIAHRQFLTTVSNHESGFSAELTGDSSSPYGVTYATNADNKAEVDTLVKQDPLFELYSEINIHKIK